MLCEDLPLGVIPDDFDVDEASQVKLLRPKHRHLDVRGQYNAQWQVYIEMFNDDRMSCSRSRKNLLRASYGGLVRTARSRSLALPQSSGLNKEGFFLSQISANECR
jgi:hypothetical protein